MAAKKKAKKKAVRRPRSRPVIDKSGNSRLERIQELALKYQTAAAYEKDVKEEKSQISGELMEIMRALEAKKVETGSVRVSAVTTVREKLDEMKLLKAGVSAKTIAKCKTKGKPSHSIRVSALETPRDLALIVTEEEIGEGAA